MPRLFIGLMSGTSMDAVDAALTDFHGPEPRVVETLEWALPSPLRTGLLALCEPGDNEIERMGDLDGQVAYLFADAVNALLKKARVLPGHVEAIGSHGQTIRHRPTSRSPFTLQIGNPSIICEHTGITTVADFRRADMAAGGQGAPLVPAFHEAVFRTTVNDRVILNIGGMANVSILPSDAHLPVIGFDTGPGNVLLDTWASLHLDTPCDHNGEWAAGGRVCDGLLKVMLNDPFFAMEPPKSTGREHFNIGWLEGRLRDYGQSLPPRDVQTTLSELVAASIANAISQHALASTEVLVCGGGVHNQDLMARLTTRLTGRTVDSTARYGLDPGFIEATTFAWLAKQALDGIPGNIPSVTGARHGAILGGIYKPCR